MAPINRTRAERAANLERWADLVKPEDLKDANTEDSREILDLLDGSAEGEGLFTNAPDTDLRQRHGSTEPTKH